MVTSPPALSVTMPVVLLRLSAGSLQLVDVATRQAFKMPTTLHIGSAQDLMKPCPFSHARIVIDDEQVALDIFQIAQQACPFINADSPTLYIVQPQQAFVNNIAKSELQMLSNMILNAEYPVVDVQFFLNEKISEDDWHYFTHLPTMYDIVSEPSGKLSWLKNWFHRNL